MKHSAFPIILIVLFLSLSLHAQSVTGRLVDQSGNALSGCLMELYAASKAYVARSGTDGSFSFNNVSEVKDRQLPEGYAVSDNYPNPFNPRTRIAVTLPGSGKVAVSIYNSLGQKVCEDIQKYFNAGTNYIDLELNGLSNGFYLAKISLDDKYTVIKKLVLLYGSQHLNTSGTVSGLSLNKSVSDIGAAVLALKLDSIVVYGNSIFKVFKNLPQMTGTSLDLGNLVITLQAPGTPSLVSPANGSQNFNANSSLSWSYNYGLTGYVLQVSTDSLFSNLIFDQNVGVLVSYKVTGLKELTKYYWRVSAVNNYGTSEWTKPAWSFTVSPLSVVFPSRLFEVPRSITLDASGNLYACIVNEVGMKAGIRKYDAVSGSFVPFVDAAYEPVPYWNAMKFGPDGNLYVVGPQRRIAVYPSAGSSIQTYATFPSSDSVIVLYDLDFDANKNIWTGGYAKKFYCVDPLKSVTGFNFNGIVHALRVFDGYLYIAAQRDTSEKIFRYKINSSASIGNEELYCDLTAFVSNKTVTSITFSKDGFMFAALRNRTMTISEGESQGIIMIYPGGGNYKYYLPEAFIPDAAYPMNYSSLFWDNGYYLYMLLENTKDYNYATQIIKVNMQMLGAPNYGIK